MLSLVSKRIAVRIRTSISPHTLPIASLSTSPLTNPATPEKERNFLERLWDTYSVRGQQKRIVMGERLFRAAQYRALDRTWYIQGRIGKEFRPRHAILTMHIWFLHKRLINTKVNRHAALLIQEELFDILWNDTIARIRAEGINELSVNKNLKEVQKYTFTHCMHYDHAFTFDDDIRRREEICFVIWTHVLLQDDDASDDLINRLAMYVEWQYDNIVRRLPDKYWNEGRIAWGKMPDFRQLRDNQNHVMASPKDDGWELLPPNWMHCLTDSGDSYYWNMESMHTQWEKPSLESGSG